MKNITGRINNEPLGTSSGNIKRSDFEPIASHPSFRERLDCGSCFEYMGVLYEYWSGPLGNHVNFRRL